MTERTKELAITPELRDFIRIEKRGLTYSQFLLEVFDYMQNTKKCYNEFLNHLEKKRELPYLPSSKNPSHKKGVKE